MNCPQRSLYSKLCSKTHALLPTSRWRRSCKPHHGWPPGLRRHAAACTCNPDFQRILATLLLLLPLPLLLLLLLGLANPTKPSLLRIPRAAVHSLRDHGLPPGTMVHAVYAVQYVRPRHEREKWR